MEFDSIEWDEPVYTLTEFLSAFELPQIVCVRDGYFDLEEITTLSTDQVMTLHYVKKCRMLKGLSELQKDEQLSIPVNTQGTIEVLPNKLPKMYKSVKAVKNDSAKMVLSLHNHAWLGIQEKDVLKIEGSKRKRGKEFLRCSLVNRKGDDVELPSSYEACFQSYEEPKRIDIIYIESHCNFPCTVKMHGNSPIKDNIDERTQSLDLSTLGRIKLLGAYDYVKVIASIRHMDKVSVMLVPIELEITVAAAKGARQKESTYQSLCKEIHDTTQFQQLDGVDLDYVKMGNNGDSVDNIYDYIDCRYLKLRRTSSTPPPIPKQTTKPPIGPKPRTPSMDSETPPAPQSPSSSHPQTDRLDFNIPASLEKLSVEEVANCLRYLHMDAYVEKFQAELIDGEMLVELNEEMLRDSLGVTNKLHQKKLVMLVNGWRPT